MSGALSQIALGANAKQQAICFAVCLAAGIAAGTFGLLYLRRGTRAEKILLDLFATLCIAGGFILCTEFVLGGKPELYGLAAYALGAAALPLAVTAARRAQKKREKHKK